MSETFRVGLTRDFLHRRQPRLLSDQHGDSHHYRGQAKEVHGGRVGSVMRNARARNEWNPRES